VNQDWQSRLQSYGASFDAAGQAIFPDAAPAASATCLVDASPLAIVDVGGADAEGVALLAVVKVSASDAERRMVKQTLQARPLPYDLPTMAESVADEPTSVS